MKLGTVCCLASAASCANALTPTFPSAINQTVGFEHLPPIPQGDNIVKLPGSFTKRGDRPPIQKGKIIDGSAVFEINKYPWFTLLLHNIGSYTWAGCGGTLVSSEFILTAAHCINELTYFFGAAWVGLLTLEEGNGGQYSEVINTGSVFIHPLWDPDKGVDPLFDGDYALLKLSVPSTIAPLDMDKGISDRYTSSKILTAIGFGATDYYNQELENRLREVDLTYVDKDLCSLPPYSYTPAWLTDNMFCAAEPRKGTCNGDSGGPLYDEENDIIVGITSWGVSPCNLPEYPSVFASVREQLDSWIKPTICSNSDYVLPSWCTEGEKRPTESPTAYPTRSPTVSPISTSTAVINNGVVMLGINKEGRLNVDGDVIDGHDASDTVGLKFFRDGAWYDSMSYGCACEGFGVSASSSSGVSFWAGASGSGAGVDYLSARDISSDESSATTFAIVTSGPMSVKHEFRPSPVSTNLYQVKVTLPNTSPSETLSEIRYRRTLDWDIPPTPYSECVSAFYVIQPNDLEYMTDDGFEYTNPLDDTSSSGIEFSCPTGGSPCPVYDSGPADHGANFQLLFKRGDSDTNLSLSPGESLEFFLYLGAAESKSALDSALGAVGAELASYGYAPGSAGCSSMNDGSPGIYALAFSQIGGSPIFRDGCESSALEVIISVTTDAYEAESSWMLVSSTGDSWKSEDFPSEFVTYISRYCLDRSKCYTFTMIDLFGDGLIDPGTFSLTVDGEVLLEDGDDSFTELSVKFGACDGPTPTSTPTEVPTAFPTASPTVSTSTNPSTRPTTIPTVITIAPTSSPSLPPTGGPTGFPTGITIASPSEYPKSTPTSTPSGSAPSSPSCGLSELDVEISVTTDDKIDANYWTLVSSSRETWKSSLFIDKFTKYTSNFCLDRTKCYTFTIYDLDGNGISDPGTFSLTIDGKVILQDGDESFSSLKASFGDCGGPPPTTAPILSSISMIPSTSPSPTICEMNYSLWLFTDTHGAETSWEIVTYESGEVVAFGSGYADSTNIVEDGCIPSDCYIFIIKDSAGDGMCCSKGIGVYHFTVNGNLLALGSVFKSVEETKFCDPS